jgi:hypothetical protein
MKNLLCLAVGWWVAGAAGAAEKFPFVIPGDDATPTVTDFSTPGGRAAGTDGFVRIKDGHFFTESGRLRIWGVNTCFSANYPAHAEAKTAAAHMAKLGINAVRVHHHETGLPPRGLLAPPKDGKRVMDPEMLDRQDYFLDQLHQRGIYANVNLHVGREFTQAEGFAGKDQARDFRYDKFLIYFEPRMRAEFKEFCRAYLGHVNPYRSLRRADDPGIAMVEITNENSFHTLGLPVALKLPEPYRAEFLRQWNAWLAQRYLSTVELKRSWAQGFEPPGPEVCKLEAAAGKLGAWRLNTGRDGKLRAVFGEAGPHAAAPAVHVAIDKPCSGVGNELLLANLKLEAGKAYTLSFDVRASEPRRLHYDVSRQGKPDWNSAGLAADETIGKAWQHIERSFRVTDVPEGGLRIAFKFPGAGDLWFAGVSLRRGGPERVISDDQKLEARTLGFPPPSSVPAMSDFKEFMVAVETGFIAELMAFLKKDLGVKVPITASQITYHGAPIVAATCDYTDIHAYWQHPHFPGKPWDMSNWNMDNTPMERVPVSNCLSERATWRLWGRPFTMSEWNIPAPNDYAASCVPFAALFAALQDWDGIFFFDYNSSDDQWRANGVNTFFSFVGQTHKLAGLGIFANLYRRGDLAPLAGKAHGTLTNRLNAMFALERQLGIDSQATTIDDLTVTSAKRLATPDGNVVWDASDRLKPWVQVNAPASRAAWGMLAGRTLIFGGLKLEVGAAERDYAVLMLTSLDAKPVEQSKHLLLAAMGTAENAGAEWNETRTSVGRKWGKGPALMAGIAAQVTLPQRVTAVRALDGTGKPQGTVKVERIIGGSRWNIGPEHRTIWYEIVAE